MAGYFVCVPPAAALSVNSMRFGQHGASIRTVIELDAEVDFRAMVQSEPPRLVIDMPILSGQPAVKRTALPPLIKDVRLAPLGTEHSRLTFLLDKGAAIRSAFLMPKAGSQPVRLVIDIDPVSDIVFQKQIGRPYGTLVIKDDAGALPFAKDGAGIKLSTISKPQAPSAPSVAGVPAPKIEKVKSAEDLPLVVIDAGHGGVDPGASGSGLHEKDVTLAVARDVRAALEKTGKYRVALTRDKDVFIPLQERVRIARRQNADLFVSIHADSVGGNDTSAQGASVYTLSEQASDAQTARLAARENQADLLAGVQLPTDDKEVAGILIDLAMRETVSQSKKFANALVGSLRQGGVRLTDGPNRHAGFVVLKAPDVPSVLIELGFLSNPQEVKKLADSAYRQGLGTSIASGIEAWFKGHKHP